MINLFLIDNINKSFRRKVIIEDIIILYYFESIRVKCHFFKDKYL